MITKVKGIENEIAWLLRRIIAAEQFAFMKHHNGICNKCPHKPNKIVKKSAKPK